MRNSSPKPGSRRSKRGPIASGVRSRGATPVPPVTRTASATAGRARDATRSRRVGGSSTSSASSTTVNPASSTNRRKSLPSRSWPASGCPTRSPARRESSTPAAPRLCESRALRSPTSTGPLHVQLPLFRGVRAPAARRPIRRHRGRSARAARHATRATPAADRARKERAADDRRHQEADAAHPAQDQPARRVCSCQSLNTTPTPSSHPKKVRPPAPDRPDDRLSALGEHRPHRPSMARGKASTKRGRVAQRRCRGWTLSRTRWSVRPCVS